MTAHSYQGEYRSAIAKAKRILLAAGFTLSKTTGRYHPFARTQKTTHGVKVTRIGCSETISMYMHMGEHYDRDVMRSETALALKALRDGGMPFDDRGWLACGADANRRSS